MYEITVTREFEGWFKALESSAAEQVATALEVLESAGPALDPVKASRYLLWYDGLCGYKIDTSWSERFIRLRQTTEVARQLTLWHEEVMRCLGSPSFRSRLSELDRTTYGRTSTLIERLRERIHAGKVQVNWLGTSKAGVTEPLKRGLAEVLAGAGLRTDDVVDSSSGLREMTIADLNPQLRLIYGIDVPKRQILAILGEPLDRAFYGDSVRRAEQKWREYNAIGAAQPRWER